VTLLHFRAELKTHQDKIANELQTQLDASREQIVEYYLPRVAENPPDAMRGQFLKLTPNEAATWLNGELDRVFPKADTLIQKINLDVSYKDVTFETLNQPAFLEAVKSAFPRINWNAAYDEFRAAGERGK